MIASWSVCYLTLHIITTYRILHSEMAEGHQRGRKPTEVSSSKIYIYIYMWQCSYYVCESYCTFAIDDIRFWFVYDKAYDEMFKSVSNLVGMYIFVLVIQLEICMCEVIKVKA